MNITFFIGNGFDIAQGLKTKYKDFYQFYLEEERNPHDCISEKIDLEDPNWSDLEEMLGKLFGESKDIGSFLRAKVILELKLSQYLEIEEKKLVIKNNEALGEEFKQKINTVYSDFTEDEAEAYKKVLTMKYESVDYFFIDFNYTHVLDNLYDLVKEKAEIGAHQIVSQRYGHILHGPIHIHGEQGKKNSILGVDNINQLGTDLEADENTECMIKSNISTRIGENKEQKVIDIIDNSTFIFIYGMSLGKTDIRWWKRICEWLRTSNGRKLYIYVHDENDTGDSTTSKMIYENQVRNKFLDAAECMDETIRTQIKKRIFAIQNSDIFKFENMGAPKESNKLN